MESTLTANAVAGPHVSAEIELAGRVLQGLSAVYLLLKASRSAPMHEIDAAITRIDDWAGELEAAVASPRCESRDRLAPVAVSLRRALGELRSAAYPAAAHDPSESAERAAAQLAIAASQIQRADGTADIRAGFVSSCCAADIQHITETRN